MTLMKRVSSLSKVAYITRTRSWEGYSKEGAQWRVKYGGRKGKSFFLYDKDTQGAIRQELQRPPRPPELTLPDHNPNHLASKPLVKS